MRFRLRSLARDETVDARRFSTVERVLLDVIAETESERKGLKKRIEVARVRAGALVGDETHQSEREPKIEKMLLEAEHDLIAGEKRVRQLNSQLERLGRVLDLLKQEQILS